LEFSSVWLPAAGPLPPPLAPPPRAKALDPSEAASTAQARMESSLFMIAPFESEGDEATLARGDGVRYGARAPRGANL